MQVTTPHCLHCTELHENAPRIEMQLFAQINPSNITSETSRIESRSAKAAAKMESKSNSSMARVCKQQRGNLNHEQYCVPPFRFHLTAGNVNKDSLKALHMSAWLFRGMK